MTAATTRFDKALADAHREIEYLEASLRLRLTCIYLRETVNSACFTFRRWQQYCETA